MNMKVVSMCLICAGALLTGCGNGGEKGKRGRGW